MAYFKVPWNIPGGTVQNHETSTRTASFLARFEWGTSKMQIRCVTAWINLLGLVCRRVTWQMRKHSTSMSHLTLVSAHRVAGKAPEAQRVPDCSTATGGWISEGLFLGRKFGYASRELDESSSQKAAVQLNQTLCFYCPKVTVDVVISALVCGKGNQLPKHLADLYSQVSQL